MGRRSFSREFKLEAVKLVRERGVSVTQASQDLGISQSVLGRWVREASTDPKQAFPGRGQMKPDDAEGVFSSRNCFSSRASEGPILPRNSHSRWSSFTGAPHLQRTSTEQ
jgi:transposase-like protein